jgi:choline dehydrogenase-like flavoprotein
MSSTYDFIVVGGKLPSSIPESRSQPPAGPAGAALASRLANSKAKPSVLLLEAGGDNRDKSLFSPAERYSLAFTQPSLDWGYQTIPQTQLTGQKVPYARGKGLGGSSAMNFCCWLIGSNEDFNEWANIVGDEAWNWENVKERFKKIEGLDTTVPDDYKKYISPQSKGMSLLSQLSLSY